jgi:hypothetical protein
MSSILAAAAAAAAGEEEVQWVVEGLLGSLALQCTRCDTKSADMTITCGASHLPVSLPPSHMGPTHANTQMHTTTAAPPPPNPISTPQTYLSVLQQLVQHKARVLPLYRILRHCCCCCTGHDT